MTSAGDAPPLFELLASEDVASCCAAVYEHPEVRWLLGGELHPGGESTTRRSLDLLGVGAGERLLDIGCGDGRSAMLAASERGCEVAAIDYGSATVRDAQQAADASGLCDRVGFTVADAAALPFGDRSFDAVLCECSLSTFADQARAAAEIRRVLRPGGRLAISDVIVDRELPAELNGALAQIACVGGAHSQQGYEELLAAAGLRPLAVESRNADAAVLADRVRDRLRGARLLGADRLTGMPLTASAGIALLDTARRAIDDEALGYAIITAMR